MKKSYNPITMFGTWIGSFLISPLIFYIIHTNFNTWWDFPINNILPITFLFDMSLIVGFLIGWGIHSLVRALRK